MQHVCKNPWCKQEFEITNDDLKFYDKASPVLNEKKFPIPPPTLCPDCRLQRRLMHNNESMLFRRRSTKSHKEIVSILSPDRPYKVYDQKEWWSDDWDALSFGQDVSPTKTMFQQLQSLLRDVPLISLVTDSNENSEYVQYSGWDKNCYLCFCTDYSEDCMHCHSTYYAKNSLDCYGNLTIELCYECVHCKDSYRLLYSQDCTNCSESAFLYGCTNCKNCFGCVGLRQKEYYIFNEQMTQKEYAKKLSEFPLHSHQTRSVVTEIQRTLLLQTPRRAFVGLNNQNVTGDYLTNSKNAFFCFDSDGLEDCKYCHYVRSGKDCYDVFRWGHSGELCYECMGVGEGAMHLLFSLCCWPNCSDLLYCCNCISCHDCFACAGLRHKSYCILNKQYTKEEYAKMLPSIIEKMNADGEWGEFPAGTLSPYAYNESIAQNYFPLKKEQVLERGLEWSDYESPILNVEKTIPAPKLPDSIDDIPDDILNWAIECETTKRPFKIIKQELEFYRNIRLPIPRLHPDERHRRRMAIRNPRKLWDRQCTKCNKAIATSYSPERSEIVYCEECYLKEVY